MNSIERQFKRRLHLGRNTIFDGVIFSEQKVLDALYGPGGRDDVTSEFLVDVLRTGPLNTAYSFVDRESCVLDLAAFIQRSSAFDVKVNIWAVMCQIMSGLEFILGKGLIHRAVVPSNSNPLI